MVCKDVKQHVVSILIWLCRVEVVAEKRIRNDGVIFAVGRWCNPQMEIHQKVIDIRVDSAAEYKFPKNMKKIYSLLLDTTCLIIPNAVSF